MTDLTVSILVIVFTGAFVGVILLLVSRRKKQKEELILKLAGEQGWRYEKITGVHESGYALSGAGWRFESTLLSSAQSSSSGSSEVSYSNHWFSDRCRSIAGLVLIGPRLPSANLGVMGELILQKALARMLGSEAQEAAGLHEVEVQRTALRERYGIWAVNDQNVTSWLSFAVENALLNWKLKERPVVKLSSQGIEIRLRDGRLETPEDILAVVQLGEAFIGSQEMR